MCHVIIKHNVETKKQHQEVLQNSKSQNMHGIENRWMHVSKLKCVVLSSLNSKLQRPTKLHNIKLLY